MKKYLCPPLQVPGAQDLVDFSPVYRCLHIYTVLVGLSSCISPIVITCFHLSRIFSSCRPESAPSLVNKFKYPVVIEIILSAPTLT